MANGRRSFHARGSAFDVMACSCTSEDLIVVVSYPSNIFESTRMLHCCFQELPCDLFLSLKDGPELKKLEQDYATVVDGLMNLRINLPGFQYHKALAARTSVLSYVDVCINRCREELRQGHALPNQDLLSVFLTVPDEDGEFMADNVIKTTSYLLLLEAMKHLATGWPLLLNTWLRIPPF